MSWADSQTKLAWLGSASDRECGQALHQALALAQDGLAPAGDLAAADLQRVGHGGLAQRVHAEHG